MRKEFTYWEAKVLNHVQLREIIECQANFIAETSGKVIYSHMKELKHSSSTSKLRF